MMKRVCSFGRRSASTSRCSSCTGRLQLMRGNSGYSQLNGLNRRTDFYTHLDRSIDVRLVMAAMALMAFGLTD